VGSGLKSITPKEAIDVVLCWGWIDGLRKGFDGKSYLQRYTPRGKKSTWSQINVANVARLVKECRMTEHGLKEVEAAKSDGRRDRAYGSGKDMKIPTISRPPSTRAKRQEKCKRNSAKEPLSPRLADRQHEDEAVRKILSGNTASGV